MGIISRIDSEHSSESARQYVTDTESDRREFMSALVGVSMGNKYFKPRTVDLLVTEAHADFSHVGFMLPDVPSVKTLVAKGEPEMLAEKKSRLAFNNIATKVRMKAAECLSATRILRWKSETPVEESPLYHLSQDDVKQLFQTNEAFRREILSATRSVLQNHYGEGWKKKDSLERGKLLSIGKDFLLMEIACILSAHEILGSQICLYIYHKPMPVLQKLLDGHFGEMPNVERWRTGYLAYHEFEGS